MVTTLVAGRISPSRVSAVVNRNVGALRSGPAYWLILISGFFEPLLYLLSIGVGVGALVGKLHVGGHTMSYAAFVAPAMLTVSAMTGTMSETTFNFFFKFKYSKTFEAILATPVKPFEIAVAELTWATIRGALYSAIFLGFMVALNLSTIGWAIATLPATILVSLAFGGVGMAVSTYMRGWQDFDMLATGQMTLMLFSGTFAPLSTYPAGLRYLIECTPLTQAVQLVRGLSTGQLSPVMLINIAYLVIMMAIGLTVAGKRVGRILLP